MLFANSGADVIAPRDPLLLHGCGHRTLAVALEALLDEFTTELIDRGCTSVPVIAAHLCERIRTGRASPVHDVLRLARQVPEGEASDQMAIRRAVNLAARYPDGTELDTAAVATILTETVVAPHLATAYGAADARYPLLFFEHGLDFRPTGRRPDRTPER
jgi:hypothetical protein